VLGVLASEVVVAFGADSVAAGSAAGEEVVATGTDGEGSGGADEEEEGDGAGGTGVEDVVVGAAVLDEAVVESWIVEVD
jgi:hypothetical protein